MDLWYEQGKTWLTGEITSFVDESSANVQVTLTLHPSSSPFTPHPQLTLTLHFSSYSHPSPFTPHPHPSSPTHQTSHVLPLDMIQRLLPIPLGERVEAIHGDGPMTLLTPRTLTLSLFLYLHPEQPTPHTLDP